jgi:hypothetical protein
LSLKVFNEIAAMLAFAASMAFVSGSADGATVFALAALYFRSYVLAYTIEESK